MWRQQATEWQCRTLKPLSNLTPILPRAIAYAVAFLFALVAFNRFFGNLYFPKNEPMSNIEIPLFRALIPDEDCGMFRVSLVDDPAVESLFLAFDNQKRVPLYAVANEEKRLVRGVIMRADFPIYRISPQYGEYYILFEKDTIRQMAEKYLVEGRQNAVNLMHVDGSDVEGVNLLQIFIKDTPNGIAPAGFDNIEEGSLFGEYHVTNDAVWESIKAGSFKGFSLEGVFDIEPMQKHFSNQKNTSKMTVKEKIKNLMLELLASVEKFGQVTTDKGVIRWEGEEDIKVGDAVTIVAEDDTETPAAEGDYTTEDGTVIKVAEGKVTEIVEPTEEQTEEQPEDEVEAEGDAPAEEEKPEEVDPFAEILDKLDALDKRIAALEDNLTKSETEMSAVKADVESLKKTPAEKSVKKMSKVSTSERGIERLAKNLNL